MVIFAKPNNSRIKKLHQIKENIVLRRLVPTSGQFAVVCQKKNSKIDKNPKMFRKFRAFEANKIAPVENFHTVRKSIKLRFFLESLDGRGKIGSEKIAFN